MTSVGPCWSSVFGGSSSALIFDCCAHLDSIGHCNEPYACESHCDEPEVPSGCYPGVYWSPG